MAKYLFTDTSDLELESQNKGSAESQWSDLPSNILPSLWENTKQIAGGLARPLTNPNLKDLATYGMAYYPVELFKPLVKAGVGGVEKLIPGKQNEEDSFDALLNFYKDRYGGAKNAKKTVIKDPVGFLTDASMLVGGGSALLKGAGKAGKLGALEKVGQVGSTVGKVTNPIEAITGATKGSLNAFGRFTKKLPGNVLSRYINPEAKEARIAEVEKNVIKGEPRLGEQVAAQGKIPLTPTKLFKNAQAKIQEIFPEIDKVINTYKDNKIPFEKAVETLNELKGQFGKSLEGTALVKEVDRVIKKVKGFAEDGAITVKDIYELKKNQDKITGKYYKTGAPMGEMAPRVQVRVTGANALRDLLNEVVPGLKELNQQYNLWAKVKDSVGPLMEKGANLKPSTSDLFFGSAGASLGGIPGALTGLAVRRMLTSPMTGMTTARILQELSGGVNRLAGAVNKMPIKSTAIYNYLFGREDK